MKKNKKITYETPIIVPLGELARGSGAKPSPPNSCTSGNSAGQNCRSGGGVASSTKPQCKNGSQATGNCLSGAVIGP